ncbi:hypothetical protein GCM10017673_34970 [Streptosporangium violaceochromogenes]|nr:hypothetical protein GCM10017673_34970 [Streptosporangium violaceochromogenes]
MAGGTVTVVVTVFCGTGGGGSAGLAVTVTVTTGAGSSHGPAGSTSHPGTSDGSAARTRIPTGAVNGEAANTTTPHNPKDMITAEMAAVRRDRVTGALREFPLQTESVKEILVG